MCHFDGVVLDGIEHAEGRNDFAAGKDLDLELAAGRLGDAARDGFGAAVNGVKALREAGSQAPLDGRSVVRDRRHGHGASRQANPRFFQK